MLLCVCRLMSHDNCYANLPAVPWQSSCCTVAVLFPAILGAQVQSPGFAKPINRQNSWNFIVKFQKKSKQSLRLIYLRFSVAIRLIRPLNITRFFLLLGAMFNLQCACFLEVAK